jgi:hypothetical protein
VVIEEAAQRAREGQRSQIATQLEHCAEELVYLHRQILDLPPQVSTALADSSKEEPF